MCRPTTCKTCNKTTWAGCGQHVDMVKASVPAAQWCRGNHSTQEIEKARAERPSFFQRLFKR